MTLKSILKALKFNESKISMILGALVIIVVGVLVVNYFKDGGFLLRENGVTDEASVKVHTVAKGETLWLIAENYYGSGYNWVDIAEENSLSNPGMIEVGQELTIPDVEPKLATAQETTLESISGETYTVTKGDHLWSIAVRAYGDGYKWVEIARANNIQNPNVIHPGNVLTLPR